MVDALLHVAKHLSGVEQRHDLMLRALQLFVQQGIEAKKASDRADAPSSHKVGDRALVEEHLLGVYCAGFTESAGSLLSVV